MAEKAYICEACDGTGRGLVVTDSNIGKPCLNCGGSGTLSESEMERIMTASPRPNLFDWRLFARDKVV